MSTSLAARVNLGQHRLRDALHVAVVNATRRMRDVGLADRVLAAEGRIIAAEQTADWEKVSVILRRPWTDEFGKLHDPATGQVIPR